MPILNQGKDVSFAFGNESIPVRDFAFVQTEEALTESMFLMDKFPPVEFEIKYDERMLPPHPEDCSHITMRYPTSETELPKDRFIEFEARDEEWLRPLGLLKDIWYWDVYRYSQAYFKNHKLVKNGENINISVTAEFPLSCTLDVSKERMSPEEELRYGIDRTQEIIGKDKRCESKIAIQRDVEYWYNRFKSRYIRKAQLSDPQGELYLLGW